MANKPKKLFRGSVSTSLVTVYTAPAGTTTIVTNVVVTNEGTTSPTFVIKIDDVALASLVPIPPGSVFTMDIAQVMDPGGTLAIQASSTLLKAHISGVEVAN